MGKIIGVVGPSGSGKSTAIRNLDPKSTYIINVLGKTLPFMDSEDNYNTDNKNYYSSDNYKSICDIMSLISEKREDIKTIILDDVGFVMQTEFFNRASEKGYEKFSEIGQHMFKILNTARHVRPDINVIFMFHSEDIVSGQVIVGQQIKTIGKMLSDKYDPQALTSMCFYTHVEDNDGAPSYHFVTNKYQTYPAKTPLGMFKELLIDNDLKKVIDCINKFYKK